MNRTFLDEIKYQWKYGGMHIRLIGINVIVFLFINIFLSLGSLTVPRGQLNPFEEIISYIFTLKGDFLGVFMRPWGLITSIFSHFGFMHFLFNMIFFYFVSRFFLSYFSNKRLLYTYILGGIAGGLFQVSANSVFPALEGGSSYIVGASGAVNAVFMATAFYRPMAEVYLFGILRLKMIYIALLFFVFDLLQMGASNQVAHFAHIGGALFGILSIRNINTRKNIIDWTQHFMEKLLLVFKRKKKSNLKIKRNKRYKQTSATYQTDEEYNAQKKVRQEEIDIILDKISKSGYESLTKREKQILFDQSNR